MGVSYKEAGVNKEEGYRAVELMKKITHETQNEKVLNSIGSFGAMYELGKYKNPVLVSGTDGVGTKLEIALTLKKYNTVGIDAVAMCVNDILCHGAKPLFFLDYIACGKLDARIASELVQGVAIGCKEAGAALIGGETAEMPGFYKDGDYDIAGFCVGVVEKDKIIDGSKIEEGDVIIGLSSSGLHSNGFSLVRKVVKNYDESLLIPTRIYVRPILKLLERFDIKSMAHITGGGLIENVPRALKDGYTAVISKATFEDKIESKKIFNKIREEGEITEDEMYGTFNMGIGFVLIVSKNQSEEIIDELETLGEKAFLIGAIKKGERGICLE